MEVPFYMNHPHTNSLMLKGIVDGTVMSGHPTRTTLGNSLRVWSMMEFFIKMAGITDRNLIKYFVAGDDLLIFVSGSVKNSLLQVMTYYT